MGAGKYFANVALKVGQQGARRVSSSGVNHSAELLSKMTSPISKVTFPAEGLKNLGKSALAEGMSFGKHAVEQLTPSKSSIAIGGIGVAKGYVETKLEQAKTGGGEIKPDTSVKEPEDVKNPKNTASPAKSGLDSIREAIDGAIQAADLGEVLGKGATGMAKTFATGYNALKVGEGVGEVLAGGKSAGGIAEALANSINPTGDSKTDLAGVAGEFAQRTMKGVNNAINVGAALQEVKTTVESGVVKGYNPVQQAVKAVSNPKQTSEKIQSAGAELGQMAKQAVKDTGMVFKREQTPPNENVLSALKKEPLVNKAIKETKQKFKDADKGATGLAAVNKAAGLDQGNSRG